MRMNVTINFDMDGTIADLYAVEGWLEKLRAYDATPYEEATPLLRLCTFARMLNRLQRQGYELGIISWLSKDPDEEYAKAVRQAKLEWLKKHLPSVTWDKIIIVPYGTPKFEFAEADDVLFDDEIHNREAWEENGGMAYDVDDILEILKTF